MAEVESGLSFENWKGLREVHWRVAFLPFYEQITAYMEYWHWDPTDFLCETGLPRSRYSEIVHGRSETMQIENIMSICKALRLTKAWADDVFREAGRALTESQHEYFLYLLEVNPGWSLDESLEFLAEEGQPEFGGKPKQKARF